MIYGLITARKGSKRIPNKNISNFCGKPLVQWTLEAALKASFLDEVFVSTDCPEVAKLGMELGCKIPFSRPQSLSTPSSTSFDVLSHFIKWCEKNNILPKYIMTLQPTSPLRDSADIDSAIELCNKNSANAVVSVNCATNTSHPFLLKKILSSNKLYSLTSSNNKLFKTKIPKKLYSINGAIYLNNVISLIKSKKFVPNGSIAYIMPRYKSIDIDDQEDFKLASIIKKGIKEFENII